jgi:hypothetical protein
MRAQGGFIVLRLARLLKIGIKESELQKLKLYVVIVVRSLSSMPPRLELKRVKYIIARQNVETRLVSPDK